MLSSRKAPPHRQHQHHQHKYVHHDRHGAEDSTSDVSSTDSERDIGRGRGRGRCADGGGGPIMFGDEEEEAHDEHTGDSPRSVMMDSMEIMRMRIQALERENELIRRSSPADPSTPQQHQPEATGDKKKRKGGEKQQPQREPQTYHPRSSMDTAASQVSVYDVFGYEEGDAGAGAGAGAPAGAQRLGRSRLGEEPSGCDVGAMTEEERPYQEPMMSRADQRQVSWTLAPHDGEASGGENYDDDLSPEDLACIAQSVATMGDDERGAGAAQAPSPPSPSHSQNPPSSSSQRRSISKRRTSLQSSGSASATSSGRRRGSLVASRRRGGSRGSLTPRRGSVGGRQRRGSVSRRLSATSASSSITADSQRFPHDDLMGDMDGLEPEKYSLDTKSRYCLEEEVASLTSPMVMDSYDEDDEDFHGGSSAVDAFAKTIHLAMALAKEQKQVARDSAPKGEAFRQFFLLSLKPEDLDPHLGDDVCALTECVNQDGCRYLDPFRIKMSDVLDMFPCTGSDDFEPAALSPFCFPNGVGARLVPKDTLHRAKKFGWYGKKVDKYHPLVFTDGSGVASHGVAITIQEEVTTPSLVAHLKHCRSQRLAAVKIVRWWRVRSGHLRASTDNGGRRNKRRGLCRAVSIDDMLSLGEQKRERARDDGGESDNDAGSVISKQSFASFRGSISDFLGGTGHKRRESLKGKGYGDVKKGGTDKKLRKTQQKKKKSPGVSEVLDEFLKSSPIPKYDTKVQIGVWRSAKLKVSKKTNQCMVIIRHAPLVGKTGGKEDGDPYDYSQHFELERSRLIEMLKDTPVPLPKKNKDSKSTKSICVTSICFEELDEITGTTKKTHTPTNAVNPDPREAAEPVSKKRAAEAYKAMLEAEKAGEVCLIEKCYVLMGGNPQEQSLLLASLQQLIDSERKENVKKGAKLRATLMSALAITDVPDAITTPSSGDPDVGGKSQEEQNRLRHKQLTIIQSQARLSRAQDAIKFAPTEVGHVFGKREYFELDLPFRNSATIRLPLPLPQVAGEWGLATLLLRIGGDELMKVLKLLLLERSVLVLGLSSEEVTSCACTLLELLKPYEWASTFLPLLPPSMLDFFHSPVPFVVGMAVDGEDEIASIESDYRIQEALEDGMCILNLTSGSVIMNLGCGEDQIIGVPSGLSDALDSLQSRLKELVKRRSSHIGSIQSFVQNGLSPKESVTVHSIRNYISNFMTSLAGDLAVSKNAWQRYGKYNEQTNGFDFYPSLFLNPMRARLRFLEEMAHTQMFVGFVNARRKADLKNEERQRRRAELRISRWVYRRWAERKQNEEVESKM